MIGVLGNHDYQANAEAVIDEVPAEQQHVRQLVDVHEEGGQRAGRGLAAVQVAHGRDADGPVAHRVARDGKRCTCRGHARCRTSRVSHAATIELDVDSSVYQRGLRALGAEGVPFLVGGGLALALYCGVRRNTKDLDLFVLEGDALRALDVLSRAGFRTELPFPHWLGKAYAEDGQHFVDIIFNSGNGLAAVDAEWFAHASEATVYGEPVRLCPVEETLWCKAFVMERERYDGADVAHLLLARADALDWDRLLRRFGDHWRVLLSHLVLFGYAFPACASRIPGWVTDELGARFAREATTAPAPPSSLPGAPPVCRGTLLSREQYLLDLSRGWSDARLAPGGPMSPEAVALWTRAIDKR
jgi:hypothetical protein